MRKINLQKEDLTYLREALDQQNALAPSENVRGRILVMAASGERRIVRRRLGRAMQWVMGLGMAVLAFALLWAVVQPGVVLGWTVNGNPPAVFHVYRFLDSNGERTLVREVKAVSDGDSYQFVDLFVLPAMQYTYMVEGLASNGRTIANQVVTVDASRVLFTQVGILVTSLLVGWEVVMVFKVMKMPFLWFTRSLMRVSI